MRDKRDFPPRYRTFNEQLQEMFGSRVRRIPVDAGFDCPHRDRARNRPGCLYCDDTGSGAPFLRTDLSVQEQLLHGISGARERYGDTLFLPYFQAYTNTNADVDRLRNLYLEALSVPDVVGIAVGTRPDTVPNSVLDLLEELAIQQQVWLEFGLESRHNDTLRRMNRQHTFQDVQDAVHRAQDRGLHLCLHMILGLPGENREQMLETADAMAELNVEGVKIHSFYIDRTMPLFQDYQADNITFMERDEYIELAIDVLERLPEHMIIHRLIGAGNRRTFVAPLWAIEKAPMLRSIHKRMAERDTWQGQAVQAKISLES
jgi:uncharacterized protein